MKVSWSWKSFRQGLFHDIPKDPETLVANCVEAVLEIVVLYALAQITIRFLEKIIGHSIRYAGTRMDERRKKTLLSLSDNMIRYTVYCVFILLCLGPVLHLHIGALLAGAGIAGLAIGFGAQSLIKDIITGFFILFEDQYGVGDVVQINTFSGTVFTIGLRLTRLKSATGEVQIIPNGQVVSVTNYSRYNSIAIVDMSVGVKEDTNRVMGLMEEALNDLKNHIEQIVGDVKVLGIQTMHPTEMVIRATLECAPNTQGSVQRQAYQRLKTAFEQEDIQFSTL